MKKKVRSLTEINEEKQKLRFQIGDLQVKMNILDGEIPKNGISVNQHSQKGDKEEFEFIFRGSKKTLRKLTDWVLKSKYY